MKKYTSEELVFNMKWSYLFGLLTGIIFVCLLFVIF